MQVYAQSRVSNHKAVLRIVFVAPKGLPRQTIRQTIRMGWDGWMDGWMGWDGIIGTYW